MPTFKKTLKFILSSFRQKSETNPKLVRNSSETRSVRNSVLSCFTTFYQQFEILVIEFRIRNFSETFRNSGGRVFLPKISKCSEFIQNFPKLSETLRNGGDAGWETIRVGGVPAIMAGEGVREVGNGGGGWGIEQLWRGGEGMRNKTIRAAGKGEGCDRGGRGLADWHRHISSQLHLS